MVPKAFNLNNDNQLPVSIPKLNLICEGIIVAFAWQKQQKFVKSSDFYCF